MRVLVYSETEEAKAICKKEIEAGNHASLRSTEGFLPADTEKCDKVITWDADIVHAYTDKAEIEYLGVTYTEADGQAEVVEEVAEVKDSPTKKKGK